MPVYRLECEQCGNRFEELVAYSRRGEVTCPRCKGATRVLVSAFAAQVGGGGGGGGGGGSAPAPATRFS